jgi:outer membrane receptor protein involved in Fe transport
MNYRIGLFAGAALTALTTGVWARGFDIAGGNLDAALDAYQAQSGIVLMVPDHAVQGVRTTGVKGDVSPDQALIHILKGTGFGFSRDPSGVIAIVPSSRSSDAAIEIPVTRLAQASPPARAVETVTVTSSKLGGADVQSIPIAITALSQEQLTATQTNGGPDLIKQVPNMTFTKTNFSGYSIQLRGIGTQAISVTTDPAVAVAFNDQPFIRNHFFEQEFFDVGQIAVLRGPQGTLYGRNATAGVVNLTSARPTDQFEAMASGEIGNYHQRRFEGMINLPITDDRLDIRIAGEWTKRQGYSFNQITNERIDGRDLWSGRMTVGFKPTENLQTYLIWEHFSEDDDRIRSSKQLCKKDVPPASINGVDLYPASLNIFGAVSLSQDYLSQGCVATSLYGSDAFQVPYGFSLPYAVSAGVAGFANPDLDPYASTTQSTNLRVIESTIDPVYKAKNDIVEFNADYNISPTLTLTSQTAFNHDFLWATQDYNRFNTSSGFFEDDGTAPPFGRGAINNGVFCDPQLGCADRLVAQDLVKQHSWQASQEFRLASNFSGPLNFTGGGNYLHYETEENYYVFINALTAYALLGSGSGSAPDGGPRLYVPGVTDNSDCLRANGVTGGGWQTPIPGAVSTPTEVCIYVDPNPIDRVNDQGHNYFVSQNPYVLNSYAAFGEVSYQIADDVKLTGGLRWTEDQKHFTLIPSQLILEGYGQSVSGVVNQQWDQFTGRFVGNWTPKLSFTDQTLIYGSYARGYKAGGANPPGAIFYSYPFNDASVSNPIHPLTFKPEFVNSFEAGTKNTLLDGAVTLNASAFFYDYKGYQISEIVDRTSINLNFDAHVKGAELEAMWEPLPGLRFNFGGGWEDTALAEGSKSVDLIDRTAGHDDWAVVKPFVTNASNCILPKSIVADLILAYQPLFGQQTNPEVNGCSYAYKLHVDPVTLLPYVPDPTVSSVTDYQHIPQGGDLSLVPGYHGFNPLSAPNNGQGFDKDLSGNELPNAPPFTVSLGAQYSVPLSSEWAGTLRSDFYWQDNSWARVFDDDPYDRLHGYHTLNLTLILTGQSGWQIMLYDKNVFNTTAITGTFLNSDDSGLTTNVFLTDPKLIGIRVTKNW